MSQGLTSPVGPQVIIEGRSRDYFAGTGYLGLQSHPEVLQAADFVLSKPGGYGAVRELCEIILNKLQENK